MNFYLKFGNSSEGERSTRRQSTISKKAKGSTFTMPIHSKQGVVKNVYLKHKYQEGTNYYKMQWNDQS